MFAHLSLSFNSHCKENFKLQTGHCLLNYHKYRIELHGNGLCETCKIPETVPRFLFQLKKYSR